MYFKTHFIALGIIIVLLVIVYFYIDVIYRAKIMEKLEMRKKVSRGEINN